MGQVHFGGLPTNIDVRKLREAFGSLREGDEITHEMIEEVIGFKRDSSRYRTVTLAWRTALLKEDGIELGAVTGIGFRYLNASERIASSLRGFQSGTRKQMRSVRKAVQVRTDDPTLIKRQDLMRRFGAAIAAEATSMMKEIEPPKSQSQLPRLVPRTA
jgi:hypothetical protein